MSWRLARSLAQLQHELDEAFPNRVTPDWTIGDVAHRTRASDHNPNAQGVVCAIDVRGRSTAHALWDHLLAKRDSRVKYMIHAGRIVNSTLQPWEVRTYHGSNPHTDHIHISVGRGPSGQSIRAALYDDDSPWLITEEDDMTMYRGTASWGAVITVQRRLNLIGHDAGPDDGKWGPKTSAAVDEFRRRHGFGSGGELFPLEAQFRLLEIAEQRRRNAAIKTAVAGVLDQMPGGLDTRTVEAIVDAKLDELEFDAEVTIRQ